MSFAINRRNLLAGLASTAFTLPALAAAPFLGISRPQHYRFRIGNFEVTTIQDGVIQVPGPYPSFGQNASAKQVKELAKAHFLPAEQMEVSFTVTIVNTGSELILFDAGHGGNTGRRRHAGLLLERLAEAGYSADQVDLIVLTHFHRDHIGGLMEKGRPAFPNARYVMPAAEFDFWSPLERAEVEATSEVGKLVQSNIMPLIEKTAMITPGQSVVTGIEAIDAAGHTPGHTAYSIESNGQRLIIIGDLCNHYIVSLKRPDWHNRFDMDKEKTIVTRKEILGQIAADKIPFVGYHMPGAAVGFLEVDGPGFEFVPASYQHHY